jgi:DNA-directed RNA polymerase specialized sigma24 family protein
MDASSDVTQILKAVRHGDARAADELFGLVYAELHQIAGGQRQRWGGNETLDALAAVHERSSRVVECRFFGGFGIEETADALAVSTATVERDWTFAAAWLRRELGGPLPTW